LAEVIEYCVVDQDRIFFENIGAVKELCKVTGKLEMRINEIEAVNRRLAGLGRTASTKSSHSHGSAVSTVSARSDTLLACRQILGDVSLFYYVLVWVR